MPCDAPRDYPWTHTTYSSPQLYPNDQARPVLHDYILDYKNFQNCLNTPNNNRCPGPDGVTNEIIKMLPICYRELSHKVFVVLWTTGLTPTSWKLSETSLLYKNKGSPVDPAMYRPIGLNNTLYKLWTRMVTCAIYDYVERNHIIS